MFISDVFAIDSKVVLITRPRRFGKTLNLSMLRYFLDVKDADAHRTLFANLAVSKQADVMAKMGQYPVLMLSLKGMKASSLKEQLQAFKTLMSNVYTQHMYVYDGLNTHEKFAFDRVCQRKVDTSELAYALMRLIGFIEHHHQKKVVVLMDEYDHPLLNAFHRGFEEDFRDFYRSFMGNALKGNTSLNFAVITGVMQMAGSGLFSDFNNVDMYTLLDERYASFFGFNETDVGVLLQSVGKEDKLEEVKKWYNGYLFGKKQHVMYNPWSVLTYVARDCVPDAYWAYTSDNALLQKELFDVSEGTRAKFLDLMTDQGRVSTVLPKRLRFAEVGVGEETSLWVLLLSSGYLKAHVNPNAHGALAHVDLSIPNEEVRFIYHHLFHSWLTKRLGIADGSASLFECKRPK